MAALSCTAPEMAGTGLGPDRLDRDHGREQPLPARLAALGRLLGDQGFASNIADAPFFAAIAPGPSRAVIEGGEGLASSEHADQWRILRRSVAQSGRAADAPFDTLGIMRRDNLARDREVREILAVSVMFWVWRVRWAGQRE
jgi:hypothetical protein